MSNQIPRKRSKQERDYVGEQSEILENGCEDVRKERVKANIKLLFGTSCERRFFDSGDYYKEVWYNKKKLMNYRDEHEDDDHDEDAPHN